MSFENFERGYLLPKGCKDLMDSISLQAQPRAKSSVASASPKHPAKKRDLPITDSTTVGQLAALLGQKPLQIIADAMGMGIFANLNDVLEFEAICRIARKYGFTAKRAS